MYMHLQCGIVRTKTECWTATWIPVMWLLIFVSVAPLREVREEFIYVNMSVNSFCFTLLFLNECMSLNFQFLEKAFSGAKMIRFQMPYQEMCTFKAIVTRFQIQCPLHIHLSAHIARLVIIIKLVQHWYILGSMFMELIQFEREVVAIWFFGAGHLKSLISLNFQSWIEFSWWQLIRWILGLWPPDCTAFGDCSREKW